jgi:DegV family protein with EDD domain
MIRTAIVTDTTACVPPERVERLGIEVVPVQLVFEDRTYRDGIDITPSEFYQRLRATKKMPSSSTSSPEPYLEAFRRAGRRASSILCLTEPSRFTAMLQSAQIAAEIARTELPGLAIEVMECTTAAAGLGLVTMAAAEAAALDKTPEAVRETTRSVMSRVRLFAALDTLQYLVRSGRVPQAAAMVNSLLSFKPVFTLNASEAHTIALPRSMKGAINRMVKLMEPAAKGQPLHAAVMHADALARARALKQRIIAKFACRDIYITEFTPVMGVHTGPGLVGVAFYGEGPAQNI